MTTYEFTGKSVREAIAKACEELNTDVNLLDVDVLEESARGFLGIVGHRDARIRVRRRDIRKEIIVAREPEALEAAPVPDPIAERVPEFVPETIAEPFPCEADEPACTLCDADLPDDDEATTSPGVDPSGYVEAAKRVLQDMLARIPVEADVEASTMNEAVYLDIKGDGSGLLIGKKGQTLDALQLLVNKILNKANPPGSRVEIIVDSENYRVRRRETLRETALRTSDKVKRTLKPVSLNPMPAYERRIIHLILADDREVYTKSYGEGAVRRIIVYPRKGIVNKRRRR